MIALARWLAAAGLVLGAACSDLTTVSSGPTSMTIDSLPYPSVVVGDTLRDTLGVVTPVRAKVYDGANKPLVGTAVRFFALDTGVRLDSVTGRVVGVNRRTGVRIVANLGTLQTLPRTLIVANRPDTAINPDPVTRLVYVTVPRTDPANSFSLHVKIGSWPAVPSSTAADSVSEGWLVRFALTRVPTTAVDSAMLTGGIANTPWAITDATGVATKTLRVVPTLGSRNRDTALVQATVTYRGLPVRGSPLTIVVPLAPHDSL
ncbi:MAG: hypothetical protein HY275_08800 [Gemmatimonadetes bacterium]|nr:hypothetical protein [Gemmatimonadota bacterium]